MSKTLDPKSTVLTIAGQKISGFAEGDFISVTYLEDLWTTVVGADGEAVRIKSNNQSAEITIRMMSTSAANVALSTLLLADIFANVGSFNLNVIDANTNTAHVALAAYVKKHPDRTYSTDSTPVEWMIATGDLKTEHGASSDIF